MGCLSDRRVFLFSSISTIIYLSPKHFQIRTGREYERERTEGGSGAQNKKCGGDV